MDNRRQEPQFSQGRKAAKVLLPRLRLLPVVMFVAALMLSVRASELWEVLAPARWFGTQAGGGSLPVIATPTAKAEQPPPAPAPAATDAKAKAAPREANGADLGDPASFTHNEIEVLQKLAGRREELDGRERELEARQALVDAAEERIDGKIAEIKKLERTIRDLIAKYNTVEDEKFKSLVNIYEKMKPKDAARIFNALDMRTLIAVVERMKDTKTAPVMAEMDSEKAKALTVELAQRNRLPVPEVGDSGG